MYKNLLNFGITHTPNIITYKLYCMFTFIAMNTTQVSACSNGSIVVVITVVIVAVAVVLVLIAIAVEIVIVEV